MTKDWLRWHDDYGDPSSELSQRLAVVQDWLKKLISQNGTSVISLCAGQGHDLLGILEDHSVQEVVSAKLIELDDRNTAAASARTKELGLKYVEIIKQDAGHSDTYKKLEPADIVLLCGVFGNIKTEDIHRTIDFIPQIIKPHGTVIWTRSRRHPDMTPNIRQYFELCRFRELDFVAPKGHKFSVGVNRFTGKTTRLETGQRIFTFVV